MKIKVTPEGRPNIFIPDKNSLKAWIKSKKFKTIHNFMGGGAMVIGADHSVKSVFADIDNGERIAILAEDERKGNFNHALAIITNNELQMYDIGEVKLTDLEVQE